MGPLGCASRFVIESLRGMKGVVAASSTGWGVARFMLVVAAQNDLWLLVWSWQKTRQWLLCLPHQMEASGGSGFYSMAQRENSLLETAWSTAVAYTKRQKK